MTLRPTPSTLMSISVPLIVAGLGETLIDVTDTLFLAAYGTLELGAVAIADSLYEVLVMGSIGLAQGCQLMVARRAGEGRAEEAGRTFQAALLAMLLAALGVFAAVLLLGPHVTRWFVGDDAVRDAADGFLRLIVLGVFFEASSFALGAFFVGISRTRVLAVSTLVLGIVNVALDYALIFGRFGLPELGIRGAALATVVAEAVALACLVALAFASGHARRYGLFRWRRPTADVVGRLVSLSTPAVVEGFVVTLRWLVLFLLIERLGRVELAASNLVYAVLTVLLIPVGGFAETVETVVGTLIGQGRSAVIGRTLRRAVGLCALVSLPLLVPILLDPRALLDLIGEDPATAVAGAASLVVVALSVLCALPADLLLGALAGAGDTRGVLRSEIVTTACMLAAAAVVVHVANGPLHVVWLVLPVGWSLQALLAARRLRAGHWRQVPV
jgi:putative MATE family efflux protein